MKIIDKLKEIMYRSNLDRRCALVNVPTVMLSAPEPLTDEEKREQPTYEDLLLFAEEVDKLLIEVRRELKWITPGAREATSQAAYFKSDYYAFQRCSDLRGT